MWNRATRSGHRGLLIWLNIHSPVSITELKKIPLWFMAAAHGKVHVLDFLKENRVYGVDSIIRNKSTWFIAIKYGRVDVLHWLNKHNIKGIHNFHHGRDIWQFAKAKKQISALKWLTEKHIRDHEIMCTFEQRWLRGSILSDEQKNDLKAIIMRTQHAQKDTNFEWVLRTILEDPYNRAAETLKGKEGLSLKSINDVANTYNPWFHTALLDVNKLLVDSNVLDTPVRLMIALHEVEQVSLNSCEVIPDPFKTACFQMIHNPETAHKSEGITSEELSYLRYRRECHWLIDCQYRFPWLRYGSLP